MKFVSGLRLSDLRQLASVVVVPLALAALLPGAVASAAPHAVAKTGGAPLRSSLSTGTVDNTFNTGTVFGVSVAGELTAGGGSAQPCPAGSFTFSLDANGDLSIVYDQFPAPNDNSYGVNAVGWGTKGHKFGDLVGSDHAGFALTDPSGVVRLDFNIDYISLKSGTPSGYGSLGPFGGDGKVNVGTLAAGDLTFDSSFARNLNNNGYCSAPLGCTFAGTNLLVDSPKTGNTVDDYTVVDPAFSAWDFHDTYFVTIKAAKLASLGFNIATWTVAPNPDELHNSPAKPCPCPTPTADPNPVIEVVPGAAPNTTKITYTQSLAVSDNSYGTGTDPTWGSKGHTFGNLTGSDKLQVVVNDGSVKYNFVLDYISAKSGTPSGYGSLGPTGGDGSISVGTVGPTGVISWSTSLDQNMNVACPPPAGPWTTNSPASPGPDAGCPAWNFVNSYTVTVAGNFTASQVSFPLVHNSPAKPSCPTPAAACNLAVTKTEVRDRQVKITIANMGNADAFLASLGNLTWPQGNGKLKKIKLGKDDVYDKPDINWTGAPINLGVPPLIADKNRRKIEKGKTETLVLEFANRADANLALYTLAAQFANCPDALILLGPVAPAAPEAVAAEAETEEDEPVRIALTGRSSLTEPLTFVLTQPQHGTAAFDGPPTCTTVPAAVGRPACSVNVIYTPADDFNGTDEFTFTVGNGSATSPPATVTIDTSPVNDPPVAGPDSAATPQDTPLHLAVALVLANDVPGPFNESGQTLTLTAVATGPDSHGTAVLANGVITYTPAPGYVGPATITYTTCDDGTTAGQPDPRCADGTISITVTAKVNQPPTATGQEVTTPEDTSLPITLAGTDPDGDQLSFAVAQQPAHGILSGAPPNLTYTPAQDYFGSDSFTFTVSDGKATSAPATVTIEVTPVNDPPVPGTDSATGRQDTPLEIAAALVLANDTPGPPNESGQTLTLTAVATGPDSHGTVVLVGGTITYTPDLGFFGPATLTYTVCDDGTTAGQPDPRCTEGTITIVIAANQAPTAMPQEVTTPEDTPLPITLAGTDPDGDQLSFSVAQQPAHGQLTGTAPNLTYTPDQDFFGGDSFEFVASDGAQDSPATVVITVTEVNDAPAAKPDQLTVGSGLPSEIPNTMVVHNDVAGPPNESGQERMVDAVTASPDTHGTVSVGAGKITYTPDQGYTGPASFTYTLCDDGTTNGQPDPECVGDGSVSLTVAPANQTPTADDQQLTTAEDTLTPLFLTGSDADGDPLTFHVVHPPVHGSLIGVPPAFTYLPAPDYNGLDEFTFVTNDGLATSEPATVALKITEVNDPPVLGGDSATLGGAGTLQPPTLPKCGDTCAVIWGDPHLVTFDLAHYDFQAKGEFIAAESTTDDFEVQVRTLPFEPSRVVSMALAVAMRVAGHRVTINRTPAGMDTRIDGALFSVPSDPTPLPGGGTIGTYGTANEIVVVWPDGSVALVSAVGLYTTSYRLTVQLGLSSARLTHVVGLLGNADGVMGNDLVTRDGLPIAFPPIFTALYPAYADSWRISQAESLFDYGPGETTETFTDRTFPDAPATSAGLPADVRALATGQCGLFGVTVAEVLDACIVDVGVTGDAEFASSSAAAQEAAYGIPDNTGSTTIGVPTAVTIDTAGQTAVRSFTATAGQHVTLTVSDNTIQGADVVVRQPNGAVVTSFFVSGPSGFHDAVTLPVAGTYTVTVDPRDQNTGSLTFTLGAVPDDSTGQTSIGVPTTVTIPTAGQNAVRSFTATAGQNVTLTVSDNTIPSVNLVVRQPNGAIVTSFFVSAPSAFHDAVTLPVAGTYTITVDPFEQGTGSLIFTLGSVPDDSTGQTSIGVPTTVTISTAGQDSLRSFDATSGQNVTLTVTANTIPGVSLVVRQPNGTFVNSLFVSGTGGFRDTFTLPVTGTYTILIDPNAQNTGSVTFRLDTVPDNTGTTAIGTPTTVTITTIGENAVRSFPATAGQNVTLTASANTIPGVNLVVRQPNGTFVNNLFVSGTGGFRDTFELPVTGTYTILIDPDGQNTGSVTFRLDTVPDNTGTTAIGTPTTVTITTIGENAVRSFPATAGQNVTLTASANTIPGVNLVVRQPNGTFVNNLFVSGTGGFRDTFTLPVTGTYTILIDPDAQNTGSVTFRLDTVPDNTGTTAIGTPTTVTITTIGENAVRSFPATAGQNVTLTASANTIPGVNLVVRQPNGTFVNNLFVSGTGGFRDTFTLPVTGTYTILIDPDAQNTGSVTFRLDTVPDNTGTTAIGTPTTVTITTIGENAVRSFPATAGQNVTLTASANTIPGVNLVVRQPNGTFVNNLFVSGTGGFRDTFTLPVTGTYTILIDPDAQNTGSVTFRLDTVPDNTGTTAIGTPTTVTITTIGENAVRSFPATAGQNLTLSVSGNTIPSVTLVVRQPNLNTVTTLFVSGATGFRDTFTLPVTGTYTVLVDPQGQNTGSLTFTLNDAPAPKEPAFSTSPRGERAAPAAAPEQDTAPAATPEPARESAREPAAAPTAAPAVDPPVSLTLSVPVLQANDRPGPANEADQKMTVTSVRTDASSHGTATLSGNEITYTPAAGFVGPATIFYTACDDGTTNGAPDPRCTEGTISIKVTANQPPTVDDKQVSTSEDVSVPVVLSGHDDDGDALAFTIDNAPSHGTLTGTAPNLTYTPAPEFHGADSFSYRANDTHDESPPATVDITVSEVNDPPAPQADSITAGVGQTTTVAATVLAGNDAPGPFDESNQDLTVTAVSPTVDTHGVVILAGGIVTYTPDIGFTGTAKVAYTVCDNGKTNGQPDQKCADGVLSIVTNRPPTAVALSIATARLTAVTIELLGTDPESDPLTFAIATQPAHGTLTGSGSTRTYTPEAGFSGPDSFTYTAADAYSTSPPAAVSITVTDTPPPVVKPDAVATTTNTPVLIDVLANDSAAAGSLDPATLAVVTTPTNGTAAVESGKIRYTPAAGVTPSDQFAYRVCDTFGVCGQAVVTVSATVPNRPPVAKPDSYEISTGTTLHPAAPGILANDTDPDPGDAMTARLVTGVTNGNLLLNSTGEFTYTPHGPGIDTFVYHVLDKAGLVSNDVTVTITVSGPPGPPIVGNDFYEVQQGRELVVAAPGVLEDDFSPNPKLVLTALLQGDVAKGTLLLRPNGSFVYTPAPGFTGLDQFSYVVRDSEGRVSQTANVGITVKSGGPPTAVVTDISPAAGAKITDPTHVSATLAPPPGETVTSWTLSFRRPGDPSLTELATGTGTAVAGEFDPTLLRNGTYALVIRAVASGGGILVNETGVGVEGSYKPGRYATTYLDVAVNSADIPIDLLRTYDSADKTTGDFGVGWRLDLANFRVDTNGPLGAGGWSSYTCGAFPFLATCYTSTKPHFVTVTWPDGHLERFRFAPDQGSSLVPTLTTAGFKAEPGTSSTIAAVDNGLMLTAPDFLLGNFFFADGIYDPLQFVLTDKSGTKYTLDRRAGLLAIVDRNGNHVNIGDGGIDSSSGMGMTFVRDAANRITRIAAPGGNIDYSYSPAGDLVKVSYPNGTSQSFTYDAQHGLLSAGGGGKIVRTLHYDAAGRVTAITDGDGNTTTIDIDVAGHQQLVTDPTGRLTIVNTYDDRGNLIRQSRISGTTATANATPGSLKTLAAKATAASDPPKTITTKATFDTLGRQLSTTDGLGHTSSKTYDAAGNVLTQTDANGRTTVMTYNTFGQPLTITDPLGHVTTNSYDAKGNLTSTVDAGGHTTTNTYDSAGRLLTTTDPMGRTTTYTYDAAGQPATTTDPGGNTTHWTVDAESGLLMSSTDPTGGTTAYGYDALGHLTSVTDGNNHTRTAGYDALNRLTSLTDPTGASVQLAYDANDNLTSVADRNGQTITYSYDANSRLLSKNVPGAGVTTYTYDAFGRMTGAVNGVAHLAFTFDDADRVLTATSTPAAPNALPTSTFTYAYDAAGNVTSTQGPGGTTGYSYDAKSQLEKITDPASGVFNLAYDPTGRRTSLTRPNGITDATTYNAAGDLTSQHSALGPTLVEKADYAYNPAGLRSSFTNLLGATTYTYDGALQLTSATPPAGSGLPNEQYTYDPVGNRISSATSPLGSFSYDSVDRILGDATTTYTYDKEGNLVTRTDRASGAKTTYTWTAEHQLVGIVYPDNTTSTFRYDPLDRRVEISDASAVTRYAFDRQGIAAEYDNANAVAATYVLPGIESLCPLELVRDGQRYFYLADGSSSTSALTNMSGAVAASYRYEAFGTPLQIGSLENPFQYLCIYIYGIAGLGFPPSGPYDAGTSQSLNDNPIPFPGPSPFPGPGPTRPPGGGGGAGGPAGGGSGGGGGADEGGGVQCVPSPVQIYPSGKGWKKFSKLPGKLYGKARPKGGPKKGGGSEYISVLPTQETVQAVADFGEVIRCQFRAAAGALAGP